jgi:hypothetical protein
MSSRPIALFLMVTFTLLCGGCVQEGKSPQKAPLPKKQATKPAVDNNKKLDLPELKKPEPMAADKVVHLIYTSNVAGEADPCG